MDAEFSDTDYMLFDENTDAGLTSDQVIHNILSVCRKPASTSFDKITDDRIISSAYEYNDDVLLDQPESPPINLLAFGSSATTDENVDGIQFGDNISFDNLLSTTDIEDIDERFIQSVSSGGDFLDTEDNDLTLFKELQDDRKLSCTSEQSVSSTCLELIGDNFEEEEEKNCRVQFFKMSSLKDNRRTRNCVKDNVSVGNSEIQTELNSDSLEKRYVLLVDASDDETIEDNRSLITFLEFDPTVVAREEAEVSCKSNEQEFATSYEFFFDGEGKEIPPNEVVDINPGSFILDCNQNLNDTSNIPIIELEGLEKIKDYKEDVRCPNEAIVVISSQSECNTGQIGEEFLLNSGGDPPGSLEMLEDKTLSESPEGNDTNDVDGGLKENINLLKNDFMGLDIVENEQDSSVTILESTPELPVEGINIDTEIDNCVPHEDENSSIELNSETLSNETRDERTTDDCKHDPKAAGEEVVDDTNHVEEPEKPSNTDSEEINTEETEASQEQVVAPPPQESEDKVDHATKETGDEIADECTEPSDTNTEVDSDFENQGSTVDALQFMLLREMWRNKGFERRQANAVKSDLEQNEVFIALLKEFLTKKNCNKYIPQLKGIETFIKERNIRAGAKTKDDNNCFRQNNRSEDNSMDNKAPVIIINKCYLQITELDVPRLEKEKVVESMQKSFGKDENTTSNENNQEVTKPNYEETLPLRKELSEPKKTVDLNMESKYLVAEKETNDENITTDKSVDDACSTASDCSSRENDQICSDVELENDVTITDGQCSSNTCDSSEIIRLKYLNDISFQPFVKLEVLNLRDHIEKYRKSHRRISPRITSQTKHDENVECEVPTSQNGKDSSSESNTSRADAIENIISPESHKSTKTSESMITRQCVKQSEDENVPKADEIRPKRKIASNPVIAETVVKEKINNTNTLVPRLERIDTLLNLPIKLSEPLRPLKLIYEIGRKLAPTINDIYQNKAVKHQSNLSASQKYHIRRHRRKQSNIINIEKIIPDGLGAEGETHKKAGDATENLEEKEIPDTESNELRSERLIGSDLPKSQDIRPIERTKTVGKTINKGKIRVVRFTKINSPVKRKRGRPRVNVDTTEITNSITEVIVNQVTDKTSPIRRRRRSILQAENSIVQNDATSNELSPMRTRSADSRQLKKLDVADHEEQVIDSVVQATQDTPSGSEVNQHSDEIPLIQRKRGRSRRRDTTREEVESKESTCGGEASERTLESVENQQVDENVTTKRKSSRLQPRNLKQRKQRGNRLFFYRRKRSKNNKRLRTSNLSHPEENPLQLAVPTTQDTFGTEVDRSSDETPLIDRTKCGEVHQDSTSTELSNEESTCTNIHEVSEPEETVLRDAESGVQISQIISGSEAIKNSDGLMKRRRGRLPVLNLIQKKQKTDELSFKDRKTMETMKLKMLTVVLDHNEVIDNLPLNTTLDIFKTGSKQNCTEVGPVRKKRGRSCQGSSEEKLKDNESECTNTDHKDPPNDSDVPIRRKRAKLQEKNPVEQQAEPSGVLIEKLSTDVVQVENLNQSERDDQTIENEYDHLQYTSNVSVTEIHLERLVEDRETLKSKEIVETVDSAIIKEKEIDISSDKQVGELPETSEDTVAMGTMQQARNNLHNELYKLYFTNFFTSNGHIVRFQYVSGRLAVLEAKIANADEAESFVKTFAQFDCANYLLWKDFDRERYILHRTWLCETNGHQSPDVLYKSLSCQARIHVSIKHQSSNDYNAHVLIYMEHTHDSMSKEKLVNISK